jgi:DDE superfamily endonuclease
LQRCTIMIGVSGSIEKFPPLVIFTGKDTRGVVINKVFDRLETQRETIDGEFKGFSLSMVNAVQERAWMDTTVMKKWIESVYVRWTTAIGGPNIVVLDLGPAHAKTEIIDRIPKFEVHVQLLPPHSTSVLQVMDVGINKPFNNAVKR